MPVITNKCESMKIMERFEKRGVSIAVFGTSSHWNTEAILLAASQFAKRNQIEGIAVSVSMTGTYDHWPQAVRSTYSGDPKAGIISIMEHLQALCGDSSAPYCNVFALPHLDHAHPENDKWALTDGLDCFASVMFDAQRYSLDKNQHMTAEYVKQYGNKVIVEGIADQLSVNEAGSAHNGMEIKKETGSDERYSQKIAKYMARTGVDYIVADLGTEQQSRHTGSGKYLKERARLITSKLGKDRLVLHGTSCLTESQMLGLADDGVIRVNIWTRIARDAGKYAAEKLIGRIEEIRKGDLMAADSCEYMKDSTIYAAKLMCETLGVLGYDRL